MPSFHGPQLLQWLFSANEEDEREVLIKLSISSVVIRSRKEASEWLPSDVCVNAGNTSATEFKVLIVTKIIIKIN